MGEVKRVALSLLISCIYLLGLAMGYSSNVGAFDRGAALYPIAEEKVGFALSEQIVVPATAVKALRIRGAYVALHMLPGMAGRFQVWFSVIAGNSKGEWEQLGYYPRLSNIGVATKARFESDPQFRLQQQMQAMRSLVDQEILAGELELLKIKEDTATLLPGGHAAVAISREEYGKAAGWIVGEGVVATVGGELLGRGLSYAGKTGYLMASGSTIAESRLILGLSKELTTGALTSGSSMAGTPLYATAEGALANAGAAKRGGGWSNLPGGVRIKQTGNYWIKEVNPDASALAQWWGRGSLNAQARGLNRLGDMAPSHLFKNGKLITRDAGPYTPGNFWSTWAEGSRRLGTPFNDIRPRNIGSGGLIFDPAKHPIQQGLEAGAVGLGIGVGGMYLYNELSE